MKKYVYRKYMEWVGTRTPDERSLQERAFDFEEQYFGDMTLKDYEEELTAQEVKKDGECYTGIGDVCNPGDLDIEGWRFFVVKNPEGYGGYAGICRPKSKVIKIAETAKNDDRVLLHEMIHAYEVMLSNLKYERFKQFLIIELYEKLSPVIPDLKKLIMKDIHTLFNEHNNPLFMLKSLDLDLRLNKPLGSVYSYGRERLFEK